LSASDAAQIRKPSLDELGGELLRVSLLRKAISLILPFILTALFFVFGSHGFWLPALVCPVLLSFYTYGSVSHDLVHRNLRLPTWLNEALLTAIELLGARSAHAYRATHLHHHARFPAEDDVEASSSRLPLRRALLAGITLQPRLYYWALRKPGPHRAWVIGEGISIITLLAAAIAALPWTPLPALYFALMVAGSWIFPIITVLIPHDRHGETELTQTRLFRGKVLSLLALEHLYHLEHHLYPQVPHHNWPELARRLDPYFEKNGIKPLKLLF
jgi:beta-carotene hydroxylase